MGTPYLGEIKICAFNYAPKGWAQCNGQFLPINQNQALFSLLGTNYGGNGQTTFALPDLRSRVAMHMGNGHVLAERGGQEAHTLIATELPQHIHIASGRAEQASLVGGAIPAPTKSLAQGAAATNPISNVNFYGTGATNIAMSPAAITNTGGSQAHETRQPYLVLNECIALVGVFPSRN